MRSRATLPLMGSHSVTMSANAGDTSIPTPAWARTEGDTPERYSFHPRCTSFGSGSAPIRLVEDMPISCNLYLMASSTSSGFFIFDGGDVPRCDLEVPLRFPRPQT